MSKNSDNTKKMWRVIKEIIGKSFSSKSTLPTHLNINKKLIYDRIKIANEFNDF